MVAAVRFLTDYAQPYGNFFPHSIAHMLNAPLQVLFGQGDWETGAVSAATENFTPGGGPARHTIVLVNEHYLATRTRAVAGPSDVRERPVRAVRWSVTPPEVTTSPEVATGLYRPTAEQVRYLDEHRLQVLYVRADGDCAFNAITLMVPQGMLRDSMLEAARRLRIGVREEGDGIAWLLRQAVDSARAELSPEVVNGLTGEVEQLAAVTGQHLRLFLAYLMEHDPLGVRPELFAPDEDDIYEDAWTWSGLVAATRRLADYAEPYGVMFSELAAHYLDLPLQVLAGTGIPHFLRPAGARRCTPAC